MADQPANILIVDDNSLSRMMLSVGVKKEGHTVVMAEGGREALELLRFQPFDLVLLDLLMPEMDGYQVLEALKADPDLARIPVIMITSVDEIESAVRCIEMGAEDYLPKPFNPVLLKARIDTCVEKKRHRDKEMQYLQQVGLLTAAAAAVETGAFQPDSVESVAAREDELGRLARVFQRMAREVYAREQRLQQQLQQLRIEIDEKKKAQQVAEVTETEYFQQLQQRASDLRRRQRVQQGTP